MNLIVTGNDQPTLRGSGGCLTPVGWDDPSAETLVGQSRLEVVGLPRLQFELMRALLPIEQVDALYADKDDEGVLMVFVVVPEHDSHIYEAVLEAEEKAQSRTSEPFELRLRAHQGRNTRCAVPLRSIPLFLR